MPLEPSYFVVGLLPEDVEENRHQYLLLFAKKMITVSWLRQPPTSTQWREKVKEVYHMESLTARLQLNQVFLTKWCPIMTYLFK